MLEINCQRHCCYWSISFAFVILVIVRDRGQITPLCLVFICVLRCAAFVLSQRTAEHFLGLSNLSDSWSWLSMCDSHRRSKRPGKYGTESKWISVMLFRPSFYLPSYVGKYVGLSTTYPVACSLFIEFTPSWSAPWGIIIITLNVSQVFLLKGLRLLGAAIQILKVGCNLGTKFVRCIGPTKQIT